jgi:hypothetical protein
MNIMIELCPTEGVESVLYRLVQDLLVLIYMPYVYRTIDILYRETLPRGNKIMEEALN